MKRLELAVESIILASRWLLVVFYLGLGLALAVYAVSFAIKLWSFSTAIMSLNETDTILRMLSLIDAALVASLVVMVIISGYENFVSRFDEHDGEVHWLGTIDVGSLKIKVASTIVAISSIHLLQVFLNHAQFTTAQLMWLTIMHLAFVVSALLLAYIDRVTGVAKLGKSNPYDEKGPDL
ncbi:MAG: TIGR00645 family protein [Rhizobiaceae bacterium]|nr:TIGR00645 family protein [Rhizobiaceae bacterium]